MTETPEHYGQRPFRLVFHVDGQPRPKQSFRYDGGGRGHTDPAVKEWQNQVAKEARLTMLGTPPVSGPLAVTLDFWLPDNRRRDPDNLSKAVLDALNKIVYVDDSQIVHLSINKYVRRTEPGVTIEVEETGEIG